MLVRHAEAVPTTRGRADHARSLTAAGAADALALSQWLTVDREVRLSHVLTSTAARATTTAEYVAIGAGIPAGEIARELRLYNSDFGTFLDLLAGRDDDVSGLAVVGHNPTISQVATWLTAEPIELSTGGAVQVELQLERWSDITAARGLGRSLARRGD